VIRLTARFKEADTESALSGAALEGPVSGHILAYTFLRLKGFELRCLSTNNGHEMPKKSEDVPYMSRIMMAIIHFMRHLLESRGGGAGLRGRRVGIPGLRGRMMTVFYELRRQLRWDMDFD
jgi:hypothetical protein